LWVASLSTNPLSREDEMCQLESKTLDHKRTQNVRKSKGATGLKRT
jgi:hypothetical protein